MINSCDNVSVGSFCSIEMGLGNNIQCSWEGHQYRSTNEANHFIHLLQSIPTLGESEKSQSSLDGWDAIDLNNDHQVVVNKQRNKAVECFLSVKQAMIEYVMRLHRFSDYSSAEILDGFFRGRRDVSSMTYKRISKSPYIYQLKFIGNGLSHDHHVNQYLFPVKDFISDQYTYLVSASPKLPGNQKEHHLGSGTFNTVKLCVAFDMRNGQESQMAFKFVNKARSFGGSHTNLTHKLDRLKEVASSCGQVRGLGLPLGYAEYVKVNEYEEYIDRKVYVDKLYDGDLYHNRFKTILFEKPESAMGLLVSVFADCLSGLAALHARGLWHRDVKCSNMVFSEKEGKGALIDFDFLNSHAIGTIKYGAPELVFHMDEIDLNDPFQNIQPDLWSMGKSLLESLNTIFFGDGLLLNRQGQQTTPLMQLLDQLWSYSYISQYKPHQIIQMNDQLKNEGFAHLIDQNGQNKSQEREKVCQELINICITQLRDGAQKLPNTDMQLAYLQIIDIAQSMLSFDPAKRGSAEEHAKRLDALLANLT